MQHCLPIGQFVRQQLNRVSSVQLRRSVRASKLSFRPTNSNATHITQSTRVLFSTQLTQSTQEKHQASTQRTQLPKRKTGTHYAVVHVSIFSPWCCPSFSDKLFEHVRQRVRFPRTRFLNLGRLGDVGQHLGRGNRCV